MSESTNSNSKRLTGKSFVASEMMSRRTIQRGEQDEVAELRRDGAVELILGEGPERATVSGENPYRVKSTDDPLVNRFAPLTKSNTSCPQYSWRFTNDCIKKQ